MPDLDRLDSVTKDLILDFTVGNCEAVVLALMFGPGINFEALEVEIGRAHV